MKKITLFLGLSIVGLIGFAQQSKDLQKNTITTDQQIEYIIVLDDSENVENNMDSVLSQIDFRNASNFEDNTHELVHITSNPVDIENKFIEGAYSYNEYALNFDFKPNSIEFLKI